MGDEKVALSSTPSELWWESAVFMKNTYRKMQVETLYAAALYKQHSH